MPPLASFPYHCQDNEIMCGPACAQMVLTHLGLDPLPQQSAIKSLADALGASTLPSDWPDYSGWTTRPDELGHALNQFASQLQLTFHCTRHVKIMPYLNWLKQQLNHPTQRTYPIVPVHGQFQTQGNMRTSRYDELVSSEAHNFYEAHWIVVFQADQHGLWGNDPYFPPAMNVSAHTKEDRCPRTIIHINGKTSDIGDLNFPPRNRIALTWTTAASSATRAGQQKSHTPAPTAQPVRTDQSQTQRHQTTTEIIPQPFDTQTTMHQLEATGLFERLALPPRLSKVAFGVPRLVRQLNTIGQDYYLLPLLKSNGLSHSLIRVHAQTGLYLDSLHFTQAAFLLDQSTNKPQRLRQLTQRLSQFDDEGELPFAQQLTDPATEMIWLPCTQSVSAFFPFFVLQGASSRLLMRTDGQCFTRLTGTPTHQHQPKRRPKKCFETQTTQREQGENGTPLPISFSTIKT